MNQDICDSGAMYHISIPEGVCTLLVRDTNFWITVW